MPERKIRIYCVTPYARNVEGALSLLRIKDTPIASSFVWDDENPDYVLATSCVYDSPSWASLFLKYAYRRNPETGKFPITIFYAGEAVSPDFNIFDYSLSWDWHLSFRDRAARLRSFLWAGLRDNPINSVGEAKSLLQGKPGFCNFLYSNGNANPARDNLFRAVSEYRRADSLGPYANNVGALITGGGGIGLRRALRSRACTSSQ